jgi:glycosyltransferase involved in cell wall biosynthesis
MMPSSLPRVSIVTPSFNQAAFLEETIRSVLSQDYPDLEYIIIDGGSTDGSVEIIKKYADQLAYWVSEKDAGQADGINKGLVRVTGEVVAWLNSDDTYLPGAIETFLPGSIRSAVAALQANPDCGLVYGDVLAVDAVGQKLNLARYDDWGLDDLLKFKIIGQPAVFMRRSVLDKVGLLDTRFHFLLDHQLWIRMANLAGMKYVREQWAATRYHEAAKNVAQAERFCTDADALVAWVKGEPTLAERYERLGKQAEAGLAMFKAYYLSTGRMPVQALQAYGRAFLTSPGLALKQWRRILWTMGSLLGLDHIPGLARQLNRGKANK